jgi:hypothetical protein
MYWPIFWPKLNGFKALFLMTNCAFEGDDLPFGGHGLEAKNINALPN